jgi:hypothetical protein
MAGLKKLINGLIDKITKLESHQARQDKLIMEHELALAVLEKENGLKPKADRHETDHGTKTTMVEI